MTSSSISSYDGTPQSDKDFQKFYAEQEKYQSQQKQLVDLRSKYSTVTPAYGTTLPNSTASTNGNSNTANNSSLFGGSGSGSLFGSDGTFSSLVDQSKDLANFRLGLDQKQATFFRGLREEESQSDFGRDINKTNLLASIDKDKAGYNFGYNTKLARQQIEGQFGLEDRRQNATTQRQTSQLASQQFMQQAGFNQQNDLFGKQRAGALRGLR